MSDHDVQTSIRGERTLSRGFVAQYAAEATQQIEGVGGLDTGVIVSLKEAFGGEHEGQGVRVSFRSEDSDQVSITIYPIIEFGYVMPEVAWQIQEQVKRDVEKYTGLSVDTVNVHVMGVVDQRNGLSDRRMDLQMIDNR